MWRIISGGRDSNTQIRNTETGAVFPLEDCASIEWRCREGQPAELIVTFAPAEIEGLAEDLFKQELAAMEDEKQGQ